MVSRAEKGEIADWWWTIDRWLLSSFLLLLGIGVLLSFAASPAVATRLDLNEFHFVQRHIVFMIPTVGIMIAVSFLSPRSVRRLALGVLVLAILAMIFVLLAGAEVKGSKRWIFVAGFSIQPSEYLKPAFVVISAWIFAQNIRRPEIPGYLFAIALLAICCTLLVLQPDFGQTMLIGATWFMMFFLASMPLFWIVILGGVGLSGALVGYLTLPHVAGRIDRFLTGEGDTFQVDTGREAIISGGWLGQGPGEGTVKRILPDSHTDFVFSVAAEEFGIALCLFVVAIFWFIVLRGMILAYRETDEFARLALAGLVTIFGLQAMINMGVNLQLLPAKGMTLPFISYGGSSLFAVALSMGMVLALTRRRPEKRMQSSYSGHSSNFGNVGQD